MNLNVTLTSANKIECEHLCRQMGGKGCCFLNDEHGCNWKPNGITFNWLEGTQVGNPTFIQGLAITCSALGM